MAKTIKRTTGSSFITPVMNSAILVLVFIKTYLFPIWLKTLECHGIGIVFTWPLRVCVRVRISVYICLFWESKHSGLKCVETTPCNPFIHRIQTGRGPDDKRLQSMEKRLLVLICWLMDFQSGYLIVCFLEAKTALSRLSRAALDLLLNAALMRWFRNRDGWFFFRYHSMTKCSKQIIFHSLTCHASSSQTFGISNKTPSTFQLGTLYKSRSIKKMWG